MDSCHEEYGTPITLGSHFLCHRTSLTSIYSLWHQKIWAKLQRVLFADDVIYKRHLQLSVILSISFMNTQTLYIFTSFY